MLSAGLFFLLSAALVGAQSNGIDPALAKDIEAMMAKITEFTGFDKKAARPLDSVEVDPHKVVFISNGKDINVRTTFLRHSPTVEQDIYIEQFLPKDSVRLHLTLDGTRENFKQFFLRDEAVPMQIYKGKDDILMYMQEADGQGGVDTKEWIYALRPNCPQGTCFNWKVAGEEFSRRMVFEEGGDGMELRRQMTVPGVNPKDYKQQRRVISMVQDFLKGVYISGEDKIGRVKPLYYWTKDGIAKQGHLRGKNKNTLEARVNEKSENYPLLIDPTLSWGQWLDGSLSDILYTVTVDGTSIYAGGYVTETTGFQASMTGTRGGAQEGFVVKITDGTTPTLSWGQWLGGIGADLVCAVAVNSSSIYAGGYVTTTTGFQASMTGTPAGNVEGFVVKITDGASPTLSWGQWLGGSSSDQVQPKALAVNGSSIYAGGYVSRTTGFQATMTGTRGGGQDGFVVKITDGVAPTLSWGQWLGGTSSDTVDMVAVVGSSIYAGGKAFETTGFQAAMTGTPAGAQEGFVVKITDGVAPTLSWGQWLGGLGSDQLNALAVNGSSIYTGGYVPTTTGFQATMTGTPGGGQEGFAVKITDGASPTLSWGLWLGVIGSDQVSALAVNGSSIYAGGQIATSTGFQAPMTGTHAGGVEGFVVKITDGAYPRLSWGQWLGGIGTDQVQGLAVNGSSIYAGGQIAATTGIQATMTGTPAGSSAGFVIKEADSSDAIYWNDGF